MKRSKKKKKKKKKKTKQKEECRLLQMLLGPLKIQNNAADDSLNIIFFLLSNISIS